MISKSIVEALSFRMRRSVVVAGAASLGIAAIACGSPEPGDPTPVTTFKITPADPGATTPTPAAEETTTEPSGEGAATVSTGATRLELAAVGSVFDEEELEAAAGDVVIVFDNRDAGVVHNLHVYEGEDADGESVGETELETGPIVQELAMTLVAGDYFYVCDAHPTTMEGTLSIQE